MNKQITLLLLITLFLAGCTLPNTHKESLINRLEHSEEEIFYLPSISIEEKLIDYQYLPFPETESEIAPFHVLTRQDELTKYPCSNCHSSAQTATPKNAPPAHTSIYLEHAAPSVMNCTSCHASDSDNPDSLHSLTEEPITFDQSYFLCAQCHNNQFEDWQGGAHGKSIGGWAPPRVIQNCVGCHNPHKPTLEPRWPAVINGNR